MRTATGGSVPVLSMILGQKTLFLYSPSNPNGQIELAFQSKYGSIVTYSWLGDRSILVGFSSGFLLNVSTGRLFPPLSIVFRACPLKFQF